LSLKIGGALIPSDMSVQKVDVRLVNTKFLIFTVCRLKFTKFGTPVREWSQFATPFSNRRYLIPIQRYLQYSCKIA